jgi:hypothetical protein
LEGKERNVPACDFDYCFPGDELGFKWTVLVGKERFGKAWMGTTVPMKGSMGAFSVDKCLEFMEENGDQEGKVIVKVDQEPDIGVLVEGIKEERGSSRTIPEEAPVASKGSMGVGERAVQELEGEIRSLFLAFERRTGGVLDAKERIVAFMPEYAAYLINRLGEGRDGKVPYQRIKGKVPTVMGLEFGEKVYFKKKHGNKLEKIKARWELGVFVGVKRKSNELLVVNKEGSRYVRSPPFFPRNPSHRPDIP